MLETHPRHIVLVGFPGALALDMVGPLEVFSMANSCVGRTVYVLMLASEAGGAIACSSGVALAGAVRLADLPARLDTVLISGGPPAAVDAAAASGVPGWVSGRADGIRRIGSVCSGALVLAAAGLLDGRRATTHWGFCERLQAEHPAVRVEPDAIYVADPPIYTSAGVTAGLDLALALVEMDCGPATAMACARDLVLFMRRGGGQSQFSPALTIQAAATPSLQRLMADVAGDPRGRLGVADLAARAGMSERNLSRQLKKQTGLSPAAFVEAARVEVAKSLLESSDWPLPRIAERAGFGSVHSLHRAFQKRLKTTPAGYRQRFGRSGTAAPAP